ncbi:MAG TPA: peptidylprolyl isomerase [Chthoniobacterales bacterium]|jgi:cyclophilin family peptidyl-prolyl cis-trans isomerase
MKIPRLRCLLAVLILTPGLAGAWEYPRVNTPIAPINLVRGGASTTLNLAGVFGVNDVNGPLVQFSYQFNETVFGMYMEMYPDVTPRTVENFRRYLTEGAYNGTFIHRSEPNFVIQGGGHRFESPTSFPHITQHDPIVNEFKLSNSPGTVAMAKLAGNLNSATSEWFVNLGNNSFLDAPDQRFTVFGRVLLDGLSNSQAIGNFQRRDLNPENEPEGPLGNVPYVSENGSDYLLVLNDAREVPLLRFVESQSGYLTITATSSNPGIAAAVMTPTGLMLTSGAVGTATITVRATDPLGQWLETAFVVGSVDPRRPLVSIRATVPSTKEGSPRAGRIRISRTKPFTRPLTVKIGGAGSTVANGADIVGVPALVRIPVGRASVDVTVLAKKDARAEGTEIFTATVQDGAAYTVAPARTASVTIIDAQVPVVTMAVLDGVTREGTNDVAIVQFSRTGSTAFSLPISMGVGGNTEYYEEYQEYTITPGELVIPAGQTSVQATFSARADGVKESPETIELISFPSTLYNVPQPVTLTVLDTP